jgi:hypothetical protein
VIDDNITQLGIRLRRELSNSSLKVFRTKKKLNNFCTYLYLITNKYTLTSNKFSLKEKKVAKIRGFINCQNGRKFYFALMNHYMARNTEVQTRFFVHLLNIVGYAKILVSQ